MASARVSTSARHHASSDRVIPPDAERFMAKRAGATTVEIESFTGEPSPMAGVMYRIGAVIWVEREGQ